MSLNIMRNTSAAAQITHDLDKCMASSMQLDPHINMIVVDRGATVNYNREVHSPSNAIDFCS